MNYWYVNNKVGLDNTFLKVLNIF